MLEAWIMMYLRNVNKDRMIKQKIRREKSRLKSKPTSLRKVENFFLMYICSNVQISRYRIATCICTICLFRMIYYLGC